MIEKKPTPLLQKIFELRRAKGINLEALGKVLGGVTPEAASKVENGQTPLKAEYIPAVAKLLGVQIWELFAECEGGGRDLKKPDEATARLLETWLALEDSDRALVMSMAARLKDKLKPFSVRNSEEKRAHAQKKIGS